MENLVQAQFELHGRIARAFENLKKAGTANITIGLVEARLQGLEANWAKFDAQHDKLVMGYWEALANHDYRTQEVHLLAENAYFSQKGAFLDALRSMKAQADSKVTASPVAHTPRSTMPRLQLPTFSGRYEDWPPFRDLFHSIIGKEATMTAVEKLHYLKASLRGEAERMIRDLPTTDDNFGRAWQILTAFFENKRILVHSYVTKFTALKKLKGESTAELSTLYHGLTGTINSLDGIGRGDNRWEDIVVHIAIDLLDSRSRRAWEDSLTGSTNPPSYDTFRQFLEQRLHTLVALHPNQAETNPAKASASSTRQPRALHARKQEKERGRCSLCSKDHYILWCPSYQNKTAEERKRHIEANNLCLNCLGKHKLTECNSKKTCSSCSSRHHTSVHDACKEGVVATTTSHFARRPNLSAVLLATARVRVADRNGVLHTVRALIDQGSETSLISEALAQLLKLPRKPTSVVVLGVGGVKTGAARGQVSLELSPRGDGPSLKVAALVFPRLTLYDGGIRAEQAEWTHLSGLELADPDFLAADPVDLLLGAPVFATILQPGLRKGSPREPVAQQTSLGWILSGTVGSGTSPRRAMTQQCRADDDLVALVRGFWQQDELPNLATLLTPEERICEDFFLRTHTRIENGRYMVRLPVVTPLPDLSATRLSALRVLSSMERRFSQDSRLQELYVEFMQAYEDLGHMTPTDPYAGAVGRVSYLPHHGVMRESSTTTKLRVVFNGSTTIPSGESLNRCLLVGSNLLPPLADLLLRWRKHRYVLATDVEKMYRQILVHPDDRDLQRIIWRCKETDERQEFRLNTVTYGLACAPFLAMRTLRQLASDEAERYPQGAAVLVRDTYMDDVLTGAATLEEAQVVRQQLTDLCTAGGFPLRKWSANDDTLLAGIPADHRMQRDLRAWQPHEAHATLGLQWHPGTDEFSFSTREIGLKHVTKRSVLSLTARLFDPLGWLAPVVVSAKIDFQSTWLQGLDWDDHLDEQTSQRWRAYQAELPLLEDIRVPRWIGPSDGESGVELHGFADASERAYGAVVYLRAAAKSSWSITLIAAKTKVAPIKQVSLPRLELCAATLLARLASHVRLTLGLSGASLHLWTDSTVVLGWVRGHPTRWQTYVANRVSEIQTTVPEARWRHIPGRDNPADCASRGLSPRELVAHPLWWQGPPWLNTESSSWPIQTSSDDHEELPEARTRAHVTKAEHPLVKEAEELGRFSSLCRLLRVTAWCRRWLRLRASTGSAVAPSPPLLGDQLAATEIDEACSQWILRIQADHFASEVEMIQRGDSLPKANPLVRLSPFTDSSGILRVGGRIKHAMLSYDERHPRILPGESHFTRLVVEACHRRALHGGVQSTLGILRQRYWVPQAGLW